MAVTLPVPILVAALTIALAIALPATFTVFSIAVFASILGPVPSLVPVVISVPPR